jgi:hypothetical protein
MHKESRYPVDDAPVHNPAAWRVRSAAPSGARYSSGVAAGTSETSFLERIHESGTSQSNWTNFVGAGGLPRNDAHRATGSPSADVKSDGDFVGIKSIAQAWTSSYRVPAIEATESELLAARAIAAGEYRFVGRMILWALWALMRVLLLSVLPAGYQKSFLESSMFTWSITKDDKTTNKKPDGGQSSTTGSAPSSSIGEQPRRREESMRSVSPASRRSLSREADDPKPFEF